MADHTPGPWSWEYLDGRPIALSSDSTQEDALVATGDDGRSWADVTEANARLIASAPCLLEACEAFAHQLDYLTALWGDEGITRNVRDRVLTAIARAKGGAA